jgi:ABC-type transporter Mla MlaB component
LLIDRGMVLRIDRTTDAELVILTLSGHLALDDLQGLRQLVKSESAEKLVLDLGDVIQVDSEAVALLSSFTAAGVELRRCPAHIVASMVGRPKGLT